MRLQRCNRVYYAPQQSYYSTSTAWSSRGPIGEDTLEYSGRLSATYLLGNEHSAVSLMDTCVRESLMLPPEDGWSIPASRCRNWLASAASLRFCMHRGCFSLNRSRTLCLHYHQREQSTETKHLPFQPHRLQALRGIIRLHECFCHVCTLTIEVCMSRFAHHGWKHAGER
jgi:hypothetical protein